MTEDKKGVSNGPASSEMAPQEDGTKVPLTNDDPEVKFTSTNNPPNGDAKIDIGTAPTFTGLSKEDLMKYADDPFWVRLRWFLFILFWAGWLLMLILAIVIIIQAPRCAAKETLEWVQESAMVQYDINAPVDVNNNGEETPEDLIQMAKDLGVTTVYLKDLINPLDFTEINPTYNADDVNNILKEATNAGLHVVTDFVDNEVPESNPWYQNGSNPDFFKPNTRELNYANTDLLTKLAGLVSGTWYGYGVKGFLMPTAVSEGDGVLMKNASITLSETLKTGGGAVVYGETEVSTMLNSVSVYKQFLMEQVDENDWAYFKYNPKIAESTMSPKEMVHLVTLSLFMVRGTPILDGFNKEYFDQNKAFIKSLSDFRGKESVQVGNITFAETADDVIAYARVEKGTPGYAVAVNMQDAPAAVNFTSIEGVPGKGENELKLTANATILQNDLGSSQLDSVSLEAYEGIVVQFVPNF